MGAICCPNTRIEDDMVNNTKPTITQQADSMQEVLPQIYMGSAKAAKDKQLLQQHNVTHIIAIGWNLVTHFEDDFKYLLLNKVEDSPEQIIIQYFSACFDFIDECLTPNEQGYSDDSKSSSRSQLLPTCFVHCHKGLSRSATIIIAYDMWKHPKLGFTDAMHRIRKKRSMIMPNIGFQAQLNEFKNKNCSLNIDDYADFNVIEFIQQRLPKMLTGITRNYNCFKNNNTDDVDESELFELTLYTHQVHKLRNDRKEKLTLTDVKTLEQMIRILRSIQVEYVKDAASIKRFDIMFKNKSVITKPVEC